jgi:histidyl-tRNA synthetase
MLSPDSAPLVIRWIAAQEKTINPHRLFFTSPVFRYRNQKYRYFRHVGFALANAADNCEQENVALITLFSLMSQFFRDDCDHPVSITLSDAGIWHELLSDEIPAVEERRKLLHQLRFRKQEHPESLLGKQIRSTKTIDLMIRLLECGELNTDYSVRTSARWARLNSLREKISLRAGVCVNVEPGCLRGTETQNSITAQFKNDKGELCGDGGCYSDYARNISSSVRSFFSVATGLEYLVENQRPKPSPPMLCILSFDDMLDQAQQIEFSLRANGIGVLVQPVTRNLAATERLLPPNTEWVVIVGRKESLCGRFEIRSTKRGATRTVSISELIGLTLPVLQDLFDG